jgi:hypothetical protein
MDGGVIDPRTSGETTQAVALCLANGTKAKSVRHNSDSLRLAAPVRAKAAKKGNSQSASEGRVNVPARCRFLSSRLAVVPNRAVVVTAALRVRDGDFFDYNRELSTSHARARKEIRFSPRSEIIISRAD